MTAISFSSKAGLVRLVQKKIGRAGPLGLIVLLHAGVFYLLQSGVMREAEVASPQEIVASLIAAEPAAKPDIPQAAPAPPRSVPPVPKQAARPTPVALPAAEMTSEPAPAPTVAAPSEAIATAAPQLQSAPAVPFKPKTVSGVEYVQAPRPEYPPLAKRAGEQGKVILRVLVNQKGRPERIETHQSSGSTRLDDAAVSAAWAALFKPHLEDGRPVAVYALVPINFSIQ